MNMSWYQVGSTEESRRRAKDESSKSIKPMRFWLNPGEEKRLIIVDDVEFCVWEHQVMLPGSPNPWGNYETCIAGMDGDAACPLCLADIRRSHKAFITVIDTTGYTSKKDGRLVKYGRYLFPMPNADLDRFIAFRTRYTSLVGAMLDVKRTSKDASRIGDMWDVVPFSDDIKINPKILEDEKLFYKSQRDGKLYPPEAYDYLKIFEPRSKSELRELASGKYSQNANDANQYTGKGGYSPPGGGEADGALY